MKIKQVGIVIIGLFSIGMYGCATDAPYKVDQSITSQYVSSGEIQIKDDKALGDRLTGVLSDQFKGSKVAAIVRFDNVLLVGQVLTNSDKLRMVDICKKWPGTKMVFDYLTVNPKPALNTSSSLASKAMNLIKIHYDISPDNVKLVVVDGVVYIMGTNFGNLNAYSDAMENMYNIDGVHKVVNLEQVGPMDYHVQVFQQFE
jgi:osmotically-inducible protein OsmY